MHQVKRECLVHARAPQKLPCVLYCTRHIWRPVCVMLQKESVPRSAHVRVNEAHQKKTDAKCPMKNARRYVTRSGCVCVCVSVSPSLTQQQSNGHG